MIYPTLMLVTDRRLMKPTFAAALESALRGGAGLVQLREKDLTGRELLSLARQAKAICDDFGASLLINMRADIARTCGARGVHLPQHEISPRDLRKCLPRGAWCSVSVHDEASARQAEAEGADYIVFGTVFETTSHMSTHVAGLEGLQRLQEAVGIPVYAIGGINARNAQDCREVAWGIAVRSAIWEANDVQKAVRALLDCAT